MKLPVGVTELPYSPSFFSGVTPSPRGSVPLAFPALIPRPSGGLPSALPLCQAFGSSAFFVSKVCHGSGENPTRGEAMEVLEMPIFCDFSRICYLCT